MEQELSDNKHEDRSLKEKIEASIRRHDNSPEAEDERAAKALREHEEAELQKPK